MSTKRNVFHKLNDPPSFVSGIIQPIYHSKDGNNIYMLIDDDASNPKPSGIWQYNLDKQFITNKYNKPDNIRLDSFGYCMDRNNEIIYIMGGGNFILTSLNLNTNQWNTVENDENLHKDGLKHVFENCYFIPSPSNQLHITCGDHFKYNESNQKLTKLGDNTELLERDERFMQNYRDVPTRFIYRQLTQTLMLFQNLCDYISICDINNNIWAKYERGLPNDGRMEFKRI